jgi:hypothetical protein
MRSSALLAIAILSCFLSASRAGESSLTAAVVGSRESGAQQIPELLAALAAPALARAIGGAKLPHSAADDIAGDCSPQVCCCYPNNDETAVCVASTDVCYQKNGMVIAPGQSVAPCDVSLCHP